MNRKTVSGIMLILLLASILTLAFNIQPVRASGTIYIRPDGSIDPPTAPIVRDGDLYTLTDNIASDGDAIEIERDNMTLDGADHTLQGTGFGTGIQIGRGMPKRKNVTVRNVKITTFGIGISFSNASDNSIDSNDITNSGYGIHLSYHSKNNNINGNNMTNNGCGIELYFYSSDNSINGNNITNNDYGIILEYSSQNSVCHNNLVDNTNQAKNFDSVNTWDDGYPSGGNYWSDYEARYPDATEIDGSGIWDTPYEIDENNQDNYPLMEPWTPTLPIPTTIDELKTEIEELGSEGEIGNQGVVTSLIAKLNVAQKLVDKGKIDQAKKTLEAFISQVQNLTDIHITVEAADILIESAEYILSQF